MSASDLTALEKELGSSLDHPSIERSFRLSVWVPTESVGKIIGPKGSIIQHIQRATQTKVVSLPAIGEKLWSTVVITGRPLGVLQAYILVIAIVEEEDDVVADLQCPFQALRDHNYLQHGSFTKRISADYNVRIFVPEPRTNYRDMSLEGTAVAVWRALGAIAEHFKSDEIVQRLSGMSVSGKPSPSEPSRGADSWRRTGDGESGAIDSRPAAAAAGPIGKINHPPAAVDIDVDSIVPTEVEDDRFEHSYTYTVDVPASIVSTLLSNKTSSAINFIATIGKATYTFISSPKRAYGKKIDREDTDNDKQSNKDIVVFTIAGKNSHNVALASSFLLRAVQGERMRAVLESVETCQPHPTGSALARSSGKSLPAAEGVHAKFKGRTSADGNSGKESASISSKTKFSAKDSLATSGSKKQGDVRGEKKLDTKAEDAGGPEMDEEIINAHLFSAPSVSVSSAAPSSSGPFRGGRGGRRGGRGGRT